MEIAYNNIIVLVSGMDRKSVIWVKKGYSHGSQVKEVFAAVGFVANHNNDIICTVSWVCGYVRERRVVTRFTHTNTVFPMTVNAVLIGWLHVRPRHCIAKIQLSVGAVAPCNGCVTPTPLAVA